MEDLAARPGKWVAAGVEIGTAMPLGMVLILAAGLAFAGALAWRLWPRDSPPPSSPSSPLRRTRRCRWKRDNYRRATRLQRWVCRDCGVEAFSSDAAPPKECKRTLRGQL